MDPFTIFMLVTAAVSFDQQLQAGTKAKAQSETAAFLSEMETKEEARRLQKQQEANEAKARAMAAASGVGGLSTNLVLSDQEQEHGRQLDWLKLAGQEKAKQIRKQGDKARSSARSGAYTQLATTLGTMYMGGAFDSATPPPNTSPWQAGGQRALPSSPTAFSTPAFDPFTPVSLPSDSWWSRISR
jgi:hypothetical protein